MTLSTLLTWVTPTQWNRMRQEPEIAQAYGGLYWFGVDYELAGFETGYLYLRLVGFELSVSWDFRIHK